MTNTYEYWKNKWDNEPASYPLFGTDPNYPTKIDHEWVVWFLDHEADDDFAIIHRFDGPAIIWDDTATEWFFNGNRVAYRSPIYKKWSGDFYDWTIKQGMDIENLTDEDKILIKMVWG